MNRRLGPRSIKFHLTVSFAALSLFVSLALLGVTGLSSHLYLQQQLRERLMALAAAGALSIDGDLLHGIRTREDRKTPAYKTVRRQLLALRGSTEGARSVYVVRFGGSADWRIVADCEEDPQLARHPGDPYDASDSPDIWRGIGGPAADQDLTRDALGWWLTGYAPVHDGQGRLAGILVIELSAALMLQEEREVLRTFAAAVLLFLLLSGLLAEHLAGVLSHPVAALASGVAQVAQGDLDTTVPASGSRELVTLGEAFNAMTRALREHQQRLMALGRTDFLTSLSNHSYFQERIEQELRRAERYRHPLCLVMLDLDHFREVNAVYGQQAGDEVLREAAQVMRQALRDSDIITRYGGEEFAIIMPETRAADAYEAAERLREAVADHGFQVRVEGRVSEVRLTMSGGIAEYPMDSRNKDGLVTAADLALLRAKYLSRNVACCFSEENSWSTPSLDPADLYRSLQSASLAAVESLAQALDARDHYTRGHSDNVARWSLAVARVLRLPVEEQQKLRIASLLHDIGKIGIPDRVLNKQTELTPREWELIKAHPAVGASILAKAPLLVDIVPVVEAHHERYDGNGYPNRLAGEAIPLGARIVSVADAYDAMTSDRPYRAALAPGQAVSELRAGAGRQFDPDVVDALCTALQEEGAIELPAAALGA